MATVDTGSYIDPNERTDVSVTGRPPPDLPPEGTPYEPDPDLDQYKYQTGINGEKNYDINIGMTGGLMDTVTALGDSRFANRNYNVRQGRATNRVVDPNETSAYHLQQITGEDSPLMRQMGAQGMARGGARGLMNSSLSMGAAQGAMIAGAQPFALQGAEAYGRTASENMAATNAMAEANLRARTSSMEAGARRDDRMLMSEMSGYGDVRKALIDMETREDEQAWKTGESEAGRNWQTGERMGGQDFQADQNALNRVWTSEENMRSNTLAQWQTKVDAGVRLGISREQAYSEMYASIMANPDKKFSAAERNSAVVRMGAALDKRYAETGEMEPGPFEQSVLDGAPNDELMSPPADLPGETTATYGNTTIRTNADGSSTITIRSDNGDVMDTFNMLPDM